MKVLDLAVVLVLVSAATASAQNAGDGGRPGAGPCAGFGAESFNWDLVVSDPDTVARLEAGSPFPKHPKSMTAQPFTFSATVRRVAP